jgi:hypothetical protein
MINGAAGTLLGTSWEFNQRCREYSSSINVGLDPFSRSATTHSASVQLAKRSSSVSAREKGVPLPLPYRNRDRREHTTSLFLARQDALQEDIAIKSRVIDLSPFPSDIEIQTT